MDFKELGEIKNSINNNEAFIVKELGPEEAITMEQIESFMVGSKGAKVEKIHLTVKKTVKKKEYETEVLELTEDIDTTGLEEKQISLVEAVETAKMMNYIYETFNKTGDVSDKELIRMRNAIRTEVSEVFIRNQKH